MRITIDKTMVGNVVYGIPTGNNATRGVARQSAEVFHVVSIARKYVELREDGWTQTRKYCPSTGATQEAIKLGYGGNAGYVFFASLDDVDAWYLHNEMSSRAWRMLSRPSEFDKLSDKTLNLIIRELEKKEK